MSKTVWNGSPRSKRPLSSAIAWLLVLQIFALPAWSLPRDGNVVAGDATIHTPRDGRLDITQRSDRAVIDWRSFSIDRLEHTHFDQPSRSAIVVNRVVGDDVSRIFGALTANGRVVLINRHGIHVGPNAHIDVAGFLATTADARNRDLMSGNLHFEWAGDPGASILNEGTITAAEGGLIGLVAPWVENRGTLEARLGKVVLASADTFTLDLYGDQLIELAVSDGLAQRLRGLENAGRISTDGGEAVLMTAAAAGVAVESVINVAGLIEANSIEEIEGRIVLRGAPDTDVEVSGELLAMGDDAGEAGGRVEITGRDINLGDTSSVDVSGMAGGGTAHIGGGARGEGPLAIAQSLWMEAGAQVRADALAGGDGGEVILWSNGETDFRGFVSALEADGGRGGFVEVSGKHTLHFGGNVKAGAGGSVLLDPTDLVVDAAAAGRIRQMLIDGTSVALEADESVTIASTIDGRAPSGGTPGGGLTVVATDGSISIEADIVTHEGAIEITAGGDISMAPTGGGVASSGAVALVVTDGDRGYGTANITLDAGGNADLQRIATLGEVDVDAQGDIRLGDYVEAGAGGIDVDSVTGSIEIDRDLIAQMGPITLQANRGVRMNDAGLFVADGMGGLGDGLIQVIGRNDELELGPLATRGFVQVESSQTIHLNGRIDAGRDGVLVRSTSSDLNVNADIVTDNGKIVLDASRDLTVSSTGGRIAGNKVSLIVADGQGGIGDADIDLRAGDQLELQYTATRGNFLALADTREDGVGRLILDRDIGTVDNAPSSVTLKGASVLLPMNIISDDGPISVAATHGTITTRNDSAIFVSEGDGSSEAGLGAIDLSFASNTLEVENLVTRGAIDIDYTGTVEEGSGIVVLNRQLGGINAPIGGLDIDAPTIDQRAEIIAAGDVSLGRLGVGQTTLRRNIFTGGGNFIARSDVIIDPRPIFEGYFPDLPDPIRLFRDENGDVIMRTQILGLDNEGNVLTQVIPVEHPHQLADVATNVLHDPDSNEYFTEIEIVGLIQDGEFADLFPTLRQEVSTNFTFDDGLGQVVESIWQVAIDTTNTSGQAGSVEFRGAVAPFDDFPGDTGTTLTTRQYSAFLSPVDGPGDFEPETSQLFTVDRSLLLSLVEQERGGEQTLRTSDYGDGPDPIGDGFDGSNNAATSTGVYEFVELSIDAGSAAIVFSDAVGVPLNDLSTNANFGSGSVFQLNVEDAGQLRFEGDSIILASLRAPTDLIEIAEPVFSNEFRTVYPDGSQDYQPLDPDATGHHFIAPFDGITDFRSGGLYVPADASTLLFGEERQGFQQIGGIVGRPQRGQSPTTGTFVSAPQANLDPGSATEFSYNGGAGGLFEGVGDLGAGTSTGFGSLGLTDPPRPSIDTGGSSGGTSLASTGSESSTVASADQGTSSEDEEVEEDTTIAKGWSCPDGATSTTQSTPAAAAFQSDPRGGPYSVDIFCGDYPLVAVAVDAPTDYQRLSIAAGDYWLDAEQARRDEVIPLLAPHFGVTEAIGAQR